MWNQAANQQSTTMYQNLMGPSSSYNQSNLVDSLHNINQQQLKQQSPSLFTTQERKLDSYYKRQSDGPILWFAGPPNNVIPDNKPVHSVSYLNFKNKQQ